MKWFVGITDSMDISLSKFREMVKDREAWCTAVHGVTKSWTHEGSEAQLLKCMYIYLCVYGLAGALLLCVGFL